jgi:nucleoside-diphosphate-sugar epimerase
MWWMKAVRLLLLVALLLVIINAAVLALPFETLPVASLQACPAPARRSRSQRFSTVLALGTGRAAPRQIGSQGKASIIGEGNPVWSFVHIDDAIAATVASLTAEPGIYNVVDDDPLPVAEWLPAFARWVVAPEPPCVIVDDALKAADEEAV